MEVNETKLQSLLAGIYCLYEAVEWETTDEESSQRLNKTLEDIFKRLTRMHDLEETLTLDVIGDYLFDSINQDEFVTGVMEYMKSKETKMYEVTIKHVLYKTLEIEASSEEEAEELVTSLIINEPEIVEEFDSFSEDMEVEEGSAELI